MRRMVNGAGRFAFWFVWWLLGRPGFALLYDTPQHQRHRHESFVYEYGSSNFGVLFPLYIPHLHLIFQLASCIPYNTLMFAKPNEERY